MSDELSPDRLVRILDGIETIERSLGVLVKKRGATSRTAYKRDTDTQDIVERRFVKMTESALDIGTTIVIHEQGAPPSSNPETMRLLNDLDVLSKELSDDMAAAARFRNVLAHTYGNAIDHDVVYDALYDLERYRDFVVAVRDYLQSIDAL